MMSSLIALADINNFYVSCERVFDLKLRDKPVVVLSNNDGCAISRSNEAKALGIKMGEPYFKFKDIVKRFDVQVLSSNYALYADLSNRVMQILRELAPRIEIYSIDEAFLDLSGLTVEEAERLMDQMKHIIGKWVGLPVSIGASKTKTLAKVANHYAKKSGKNLIIGDTLDIDSCLKRLPVEDVWGIGRNHSRNLKSIGILTAYDLKRAPLKWVRQYMTVVGEKLVTELNGTCAHFLEEEIPDKKMITVSRSFSKPIQKQENLQSIIRGYIERAAEKMRQQNQVARGVLAFVKSNRFDKSSYYSNGYLTYLPIASSYTPDLIKAAHRSLDHIYKQGIDYKKAGICLMELSKVERCQFSLFEQQDPRHTRLIESVDFLNKIHGVRSVRFGSTLATPQGTTSRERLSPAYVSDWDQLMKVR
jgi:DNA polymerase V